MTGRWFTTMQKGGALSRAFAIVCAMSFLIVGLVHHTQHLNAAPMTASQLSIGDESPDAAKKIFVTAEHCSACSALTMPAPAPSGLTNITSDGPIPSLFAAIRAHPPNAELRPPIAMT